MNGYDDEVSWDEEAEEEIHPSTAAAMAIAQANGDVNELQVHVCMQIAHVGSNTLTLVLFTHRRSN